MDTADFPDVGLPPTSSSFEEGIDDGSVATHDQLPSVESYKAQQDSGPPAREGDNKRQKKLVLATILVFFMLLIVFSIAVTVGNKKRKASPVHHDGAGDTAATPFLPSVAHRKSRVEEVVSFVSRQVIWSDAAAFASKVSPQYRAAHWIADVDPRNVPMADTEEFRSRYVLAILYYSTQGDYWAHDIGWLKEASHCEWDAMYPGQSGQQVRVGVTCSGSLTVTKLFLPSMALKGSLPVELKYLESLEVLDFSHNDFGDEIPPELASLTKMKSFVIHNNHFTGTFPTWMTQWTELETIDFAGNNFRGSLPDIFGNFTKLSALNLEHNDFEGSIAPLKSATKLTLLFIGDNGFTGTLTNDYLASWYALHQLDMSDNRLSGSLPNGMFQLKNLGVIDLHGNNFTGSLPLHTETNTELDFLALHHNALTGAITENIENLVNIEHIDLSHNLFTGDIPGRALATLPDLKYLFLAFNTELNPGPIPVQFASMDSLEDLSLQETNRIGTIPREFHLIPELIMLDLVRNSLTGTIPSELAQLTSLKFLLLKENKLTGPIPAEFASLTKLDTFLLEQNNVSGGALSMCNAPDMSVRTFVSDCSETGCECCSKCCLDSDPTCNDHIWFAQQDPVSNYLYQRVSYKFNEENLVLPVEELTELRDFYDTFGMITPENNPFSDNIDPFNRLDDTP